LYHDLGPFIKNADDPVEGGEIVPNTEKVADITDIRDSKAVNNGFAGKVATTSGREYTFDLVIDCRELSSDLTSLFKPGISVQELPSLRNYDPRLKESLEIARLLLPGVMALGPGAKLPLSTKERETYNSSISENTAAIWANVIRTGYGAKYAAQQIRRQKF
jgi:hypothetical protein